MVDRFWRGALGAALALPLLVYATIGSFARYVADDYCWAGVLRTEGFLKAQALWYTGYSPRYAFTFLINAVELAGPAIVPFLPALAILAWSVTLTWSLVQFGLRAWQAVLLAEVVAMATLQTAPDIEQSLYWQTGMLTYLLPLMLASALLGWFARALRDPADGVQQPRRVARLGVSLVLTFVAGGLSETYLIPQNVALTLTLAGVLSTGDDRLRRRLAPHLAAALGGGVLALVVIVASPSITTRVGESPANLWLAASAAIATAVYQVLRLVRYFLPTILLCLCLPGLIGFVHSVADSSLRSALRGRWFWLVTALVVISLPFCYFPSFYAQNGNPPARALIVPGAIQIAYLVFAGHTLGAGIARFPARARSLAYVAAAAVPVAIAIFGVPQVATAAQHAALWDTEDRQIRAGRDAGQADVRVPPVPRYLGEEFISADPGDWFNVCVARYYGVRSIATTPG